MTKRWWTVVLLALFSVHAWAHRLDEYLQASLLSIEPNSVRVTMRLVPGVAVAPAILAILDTDHDGVLSTEEQFRYAQAVRAEVQLQEDGRTLPLRLVSVSFPSIPAIQHGTGEIELAFVAKLPAIQGEHQLSFANHHQSGASVYLVNSLTPQAKGLSLGAQRRSQDQSFYQVTLTEANGSAGQSLPWSSIGAPLRLGARHIAQGTDHLLFLLTLLLPAPLLACAGRWSGRASIRRSLTHILGIVTAFTLGHSCTLALAGLGLVHLPSRPVEVLIALSILVSALHALRPLFPGREAIVAASFGLVHGLAFASALNDVGMTGGYRFVSLLGFNAGIEAMQLAVVAMTLPALLLLSRTQYYAPFRRIGAVLAGVASVAWIGERLLDQPNSIAIGVTRIARHGMGLCAGLWICSVAAWLLQQQPWALELVRFPRNSRSANR